MCRLGVDESEDYGLGVGEIELCEYLNYQILEN
jgi:hypothetical protein